MTGGRRRIRATPFGTAFRLKSTRRRRPSVYQQVLAPFDGVITQRNVDVGSLIRAGGTAMFAMTQSEVIRH
jgi:multidrug efflux pump subunit AcrA (membrane-fusion protein)